LERGIVYFFAILITLIAYCKARALARRESDLIVMATKSEGSKLLIYPLTQLLLHTPMMLFSLRSVFVQGEIPYLCYICYMTGFITFLIYKKQTAPIRKISIEPNQISMQQQFAESIEVSFNSEA